MLDDHKYSLNRVVAYAHRDPEHPGVVYGPGGPERTYGVVIEVHRVEGESPGWEYAIANSFTAERRRVTEDEIFHGADQAYLDLYRRESIPWLRNPPDSAKNNIESRFWKHTLRQFVHTAIPKIVEREKIEESERVRGRNLDLGPGDYIRVRGDLRAEFEPHHNLYAKVLSVREADLRHMQIPRGKQGLARGRHKVLLAYRVLLDNGAEADIYDVEVKTVYTKRGRSIVLNWRAASFLAEAFGDSPPYDVRLEYLAGHVFSRAELEGVPVEGLADLLAQLLYVKGLLVREELPEKAESLAGSPPEFLVDQILDISRFDMSENRRLTDTEIERFHSDSSRLREMLE